MSANTSYLAVFVGSKTSPRMSEWLGLSDEERQSKEREGIAAWKAWVEKHSDAVVAMGGPLGKTKRIGPDGTDDVSNAMGGFTVVSAPSQDAAAAMFENHPHFTIFPGEAVEVMPILPIPGGE